MASRIEPDKKAKPAAAAAKPATPKPAPAAKPVAKPAAAAKPAGPPPATGKPAAAQRPARQAADEDGDAEVNALASGLLKNTPAWAISMLVHVIALLAMALMVTPPPEKEKVHVITSSAPDVNEDFEEFEAEQPVAENVQQTDAVADVAVPTDVTVVEDVKVISNAEDLDAAPLAVELSDFGSETAPAADVAATIGVAGGTGAGLGGRAKRAELAGTTGDGAGTATAVDRALKWFIEHQMDDGGWSFDFTECPKCRGKCSHSGNLKDRSGATAMALLPFLGRGYTHKEGPYKKQIEQGLAFLATQAAQGQGAVYSPQAGHAKLYIQGLAGIALCESYGMTQDNRLAQPAQLAINHIMAAQDPRGGGWRYNPGQPGDTSVVGWQIMALKSGNMAYLHVEPQTIKKAVEFLDFVQDDSGSAYGYTDPGRGAATTAVGLLCRMYLGWKKDNPALQRGVERMAKGGPTTDLYYDYYATQIMHHMEGDMWVAWNDKMKKMLIDAQAKDGHEAGSWYDGVNGGHGAHGGRLCSTSLATMILEVYYRHLPIYRNQSVDEEFKE